MEKHSQRVQITQLPGDTVTLKSAYLKTLSAGIVTLKFDFYEGEDRELTINVSDTTGLDELDTFESYSNDKALWSSYSRNTGGNEVSLSLAARTVQRRLLSDMISARQTATAE